MYTKLTDKGETSGEVLVKSVALSGGILDAVNKNRMGLLTPEQSVLCGINSFMSNAKYIQD